MENKWHVLFKIVNDENIFILWLNYPFTLLCPVQTQFNIINKPWVN